MALSKVFDLGARREERELRTWLIELAAVQQLTLERMLERAAAEGVEEESGQVLGVG